MAEEIKEILDYFQKDIDKYEESKKYLMKKYGYDEEFIDNASYHQREINTKILLNYITNLQKENEKLKQINEELKQSKLLNIEFQDMEQRLVNYKSRNEKAIEYIKKDTRWFDSEYAKIYGMLCDCEGAKGDRLEVLVNPTNLLNILEGGDE